MRRFVVLASLVVFAVSAWLLTRAEVPPSRVEAEGAGAASAAVADVPGEVKDRAVVAAAAREVIEPWTGPFANVQAIAPGTGVPIAGAEVWYQPPEFDWAALGEAAQRELATLRNHDGEAFLRRVGRATVSDGAGRCRVPLGAHGTPIVGRAGDLFGEGWLREGGPDPVVLELREDKTLRVRVIDADGQGVPGIGVELRAPTSDRGTSRSSLGPSDASGVVTRPHAQQLTRDPNRKATVVAMLAGGVGPSAEFDLLHLPAEIELRLPITGSVTVYLREASGAPIDPRYLLEREVDLAGFDAQPADPSQAHDGFGRTSVRGELSPGGVAVFPRVALDRYLIAKLGFFGLEKGFVGPTLARPTVEVALQRSADAATFVGRMLGPDGAPLAARVLMFGYRCANGMGITETRTDAEGRFRWYAGTYPVGKAATIAVATSQGERTNPMAVELSEPHVVKGDNDLGDVQLEPHRTLLAGRLVRAEGVDVAQVQLEVERRRGDRWDNHYQWRPEWQPDGTFAVRGVAPEGEPLRLVVREGKYLPVEPIECAVGSTGIEIKLASAAAATAVFLVDAGTPVEKLMVRFRRTQPPEAGDYQSRWHAELRERVDAMSARLDPSNRLRRSWTGLTPGAYRLSVHCAGVAEPAALIDDIRVGAEPCADPRLQAVDLRGKLRRFQVRATGADGQPIVDPEAFVVLYDAEGESQGYHLGRGVVDLITTTAIDLRVWAPGHVLTLAPAVAEDLTIALPRAAEVRLGVALPAALPEGVELRLRLVPQLGLSRRAHITLDNGRGMNLDNLLVEHVAIGADGAGTLRVRCPGEYVVEPSLARGLLGRSYPLGGFAPRRVSLGVGAGNEAVPFTLQSAGLAAALQGLDH